MANDYFIDSWLKKNKFLLGFLFKLAIIWIVLIIFIMGVKCWYFESQKMNYNFDLIRISLNNILTLGAVISATAFAWRQIEINQHTAKIELAIRYKDHYVKLIKALRNFINSHAELSGDISLKFQQSALVELIDVTLEGQLIFDEETQRLNKTIQLSAHEVFQNKKMMKEKIHYPRIEEQYWTVYSLLTEDGEESTCKQITKLYKKNTAILANNPIN